MMVLGPTGRRLFFAVTCLAMAWLLALPQCWGAAAAPAPTFSEFRKQFFDKFGRIWGDPIPREAYRSQDSYSEMVVPGIEEFKRTINECKRMLELGLGEFPVGRLYGSSERDGEISYARKLIAKPDDKAFVMGDFHGTAHALLDNLSNIGINEDMTLRESNEHLIFTGDLIQRGRFGVENVYLVARLMLANPGKVFFIRGNHETRKIIISNHYGFEAECQKKFSQDYDAVFENILQMFDLLPSALYLGNDSLFIQICHSGVYANVQQSENGLAAQKDERFCSMIENFLRNGDIFVSDPIRNYDRFMYNGFNAQAGEEGAKVLPDFKIEGFYRFPLTGLESLLPNNVRVIFRAHQHNAKAVSSVTSGFKFTPLPDDQSVPLCRQDMPVTIYTFMSGPEGLGGVNPDPNMESINEEHCNVRGYGVITVGNSSENWTMQKREWSKPESVEVADQAAPTSPATTASLEPKSRHLDFLVRNTMDTKFYICVKEGGFLAVSRRNVEGEVVFDGELNPRDSHSINLRPSASLLTIRGFESQAAKERYYERREPRLSLFSFCCDPREHSELAITKIEEAGNFHYEVTYTARAGETHLPPSAKLDRASEFYGGRIEAPMILMNKTMKDYQIRVSVINVRGKKEVLFDRKISAGSEVKFERRKFSDNTIEIFDLDKQLLETLVVKREDIIGRNRIEIIEKNGNDGFDLKFPGRNFVGFKCMICQDEVKEGEVIAVLEPCGHRFHRTCIEPWFHEKRKNCPECSQPVTKAKDFVTGEM